MSSPSFLKSLLFVFLSLLAMGGSYYLLKLDADQQFNELLQQQENKSEDKEFTRSGGIDPAY